MSDEPRQILIARLGLRHPHPLRLVRLRLQPPGRRQVYHVYEEREFEAGEWLFETKAEAL